MDACLEWVGGVKDVFDTPYISDSGPTATRMLEIVNWNGAEIRVPPLELQLQVNERRGLIDRVEKIKRYQKIRS